MSKSTRFALVAGLLPASLGFRVAEGQGKPGNTVDACALMSAADINKATGRNDLATVPEHKESSEGRSNCIRSGAVDIGVTITSTTKKMYIAMRDNFKKAPARLGYRVEPVSGLGDEAYYLIVPSTVKITALVGENELTIALTKISGVPGEMPPEPQAKAMALSLAKAAVAKLR